MADSLQIGDRVRIATDYLAPPIDTEGTISHITRARFDLSAIYWVVYDDFPEDHPDPYYDFELERLPGAPDAS